MDAITRENIVGTRFRAKRDSEGHKAGDVVTVTSYENLVGEYYHLPNGFIQLKNDRTKATTRHGTCVLGPGFMEADQLPKHIPVLPRDRATADRFVLKYSVTESDIKHGVRGECNTCPHARAIAAEIKRRFRRWGKHSPNVPACWVDQSPDHPKLVDGQFYVACRPRTTSVTVRRRGVDTRFEARNPEEMTRFITKFDGMDVVQPGEFELAFRAV